MAKKQWFSDLNFSEMIINHWPHFKKLEILSNELQEAGEELFYRDIFRKTHTTGGKSYICIYEKNYVQAWLCGKYSRKKYASDVNIVSLELTR